MNKKNVFFHVDIDSPSTLLRFWEIQGAQVDLGRFYEAAMSRALSLFRAQGVPATFFCVGRELDQVPEAARMIQEAFRMGHEIANHTYTHPYGFSRLGRDTILSEISQCSSAIERVIGRKPSGFRCPSYDLSDPVLDILEELSFNYDSSAYWSSLMPLMKLRHRFFSKIKSAGEFGHGMSKISLDPYRPSKRDWMAAGADEDARNLLEIPLPRSSTFQLPFYNNFHLMAGAGYRNFSAMLIDRSALVYLIHLIEFVDLEDGIPQDLSVHPNLRKPAVEKIAFLEKTIQILKKRYTFERSDRFAEGMKKR